MDLEYWELIVLGSGAIAAVIYSNRNMKLIAPISHYSETETLGYLPGHTS